VEKVNCVSKKIRSALLSSVVDSEKAKRVLYGLSFGLIFTLSCSIFSLKYQEQKKYYREMYASRHVTSYSGGSVAGVSAHRQYSLEDILTYLHNKLRAK